MKTTVLYIHGKGGSAEEAAHYEALFPACEVVGFDYRASTPWEAEAEFPAFLAPLRERSETLILIANSIGAYFSLHALRDAGIDRAYLISPIVDMERPILDMLLWSGATEEELRRKGEIPTSFGETLSWAYLRYAREHPLDWRGPASILYGERDALSSFDTVSAFAERIGASLTVMPDGEHWFHTPGQMAFLDRWIMESESRRP